MNFNSKLPVYGSSFQQAHAVLPGRQSARISSAGVLRLVNGPISAVRWIVGGISRWRRRRNAIRELQAISDHYLKDIGLDRSQIVPAVENMIRQQRTAGAKGTGTKARPYRGQR